MSYFVVIPVCRGRESNLELVVAHLRRISVELPIVVVIDGDPIDHPFDDPFIDYVLCEKHHPGMEQPRNIGVRRGAARWRDCTHVHFLDSDVVPDPRALEAISSAIEGPAKDAIVIAPYDWLPAGWRPAGPDDEAWLTRARLFRHGGSTDGGLVDTRWPMFDGPPGPFRADLSKGLACYSGNLVWPIAEFQRVGGFWNEMYHGRCEDGELGARAVAMDVPVYLLPEARGYHLWHEENMALKIARNRRDVPMLNARHPWIQGHGVFMVDRDGKAFDVRCRCGEVVPTSGWWAHEASHR